MADFFLLAFSAISAVIGPNLRPGEARFDATESDSSLLWIWEDGPIFVIIPMEDWVNFRYVADRTRELADTLIAVMQREGSIWDQICPSYDSPLYAEEGAEQTVEVWHGRYYGHDQVNWGFCDDFDGKETRLYMRIPLNCYNMDYLKDIYHDYSEMVLQTDTLFRTDLVYWYVEHKSYPGPEDYKGGIYLNE